MKASFVFLLLLMTSPSFAQAVKPGKPAFIVNYKETGKNVNESWSYSGVVKFSLSNWNNWYYEGGYNVTDRKKILDFDPALFLKLDPGTVIKFYPSEVDESGAGSNGNYTRTLGTDGVEIIIETTDQGTRTIVIDDGAYRKEHNIPSNEVYSLNARYYQLDELAELERTASGAILRAYTAVGNNLSEWAVADEAFEQVWPQVTEFILTDRDIQSWQQISRSNNRSGSYDDSNITITLSVKMNTERTEVTLDGCSELGAGEQGKVTASGKPDGGTYEFWVEPSDLMSVDAEGASATLTGSRPGRGTLYVEYTSPDGAKAQASRPAAMVRIYSYNGGDAIPQIPLYDIDGNKVSGKLTIPYSSEPDEAQELVDFVSGNPSVFTVIASADNLDIQGVKTGKATLEARDNCGNITGPTAVVEVVNCDKETVEALERMRQAAVENLQTAAENLQKVAGSKEFEQARDDLVGSTVELLAKAGLTIISSGKTPSAAVSTATKIAEAGSAISEMISSGSQGEFYENAAKTAFEEINGEIAGAITGVVEVYQAAKKFGENAGQILKHEEILKSALENWEKADRDLKRIEQLQQICKADKTEPQKKEEPRTDPTPTPTDPKPPVDPKPATDPPPAKKPSTEQPAPKPGDEEPPISPPPPTSEPRQVGLPYSPEDCGCEKTKSISVSSADFSTLQAGIKNIGDCVEKFNSTSVTDYENTLRELSALTDTLKIAADGDPEIFRMKSTEAKPRLDSLIERTKSYDEAGKAFLKQFEKCPESVTTGMDILKSALTLTVDSIKTKY